MGKSAGTVNRPVKIVDSPGLSRLKLVTTVSAAGWSTTIIRLVKFTLPQLLTVPPKIRTPPGGVGAAGQLVMILTQGGGQQFVVAQLVTIVGGQGDAAVPMAQTVL